jgi:hypothetical protein
MKKILRSASGAALVVMALGACDTAPPPDVVVRPPVEFKGIAAGGAFADVIRNEDPFARALQLAALLPVLGPEAIPEVEETLRDATLYLGATELELLSRYWAIHQPEEASRWAVERSPSIYRIAAVYSTFPLWAKADPQAAVAAVQEWSDRPDVAATLLSALVFGWFEANDPPELQRFIQDLGVGITRQRALSTYIRAVVRKHGVEAAMRWGESVPDGDVKYKLAVNRQVAFRVAIYDIEAGLRWCEAHCDGPFGDGVRGMVASSWTRRDPAAALDWNLSWAEGQEKNLGMRANFAVWVQTDREAALAWLTARTSEEEPDSSLEPLYSVCARGLARDSPTDAIAWAERIKLDDEREFTLIQVARVWRRTDEAAVEAWLLQSPLSEEAREEVRAVQPVGIQRSIEPPTSG